MTPVERVRLEIQTRRLSVREAARLAPGLDYVTNDTWGRWLREGRPPRDRLTRAIAVAFSWPLNWPDELPPLDVMLPADDPAVVNLTAQVDRMAGRMDEIEALMRRILERLGARPRGVVEARLEAPHHAAPRSGGR